MLTFPNHYRAPLSSFMASLDNKGPENVITFVVERTKDTLTLIAGCEARLHLLTITLDEHCSLKTGKFSLNASMFKLCLAALEKPHSGEPISFHVRYHKGRLPVLTAQPSSDLWRDIHATPACESHLGLLARVRSAGYEPLSKCWIESALHHAHSHPKLSLFRLNQQDEKLEIVAENTLHSYDLPYHTNPRIDLTLDTDALEGLKALCHQNRSSRIHVYADSECAYFSDEITTVCFGLNFDESELEAKPIHYQVETKFSVNVNALFNELKSHSQVDTIKLENQTYLYVSNSGIRVCGATEEERCFKCFETKVPPSDEALLYSLTSTEFKQAIGQFKTLNTKEMYLQVLITPEGSRMLGLYKHTLSEFPYSTVAIELFPEGLEDIEADIEFHQSITPTQADLFC
ncbi:hypothetical protein AB4308_12380 [Vibrio breoganii]